MIAIFYHFFFHFWRIALIYATNFPLAALQLPKADTYFLVIFMVIALFLFYYCLVNDSDHEFASLPFSSGKETKETGRYISTNFCNFSRRFKKWIFRLNFFYRISWISYVFYCLILFSWLIVYLDSFLFVTFPSFSSPLISACLKFIFKSDFYFKELKTKCFLITFLGCCHYSY